MPRATVLALAALALVGARPADAEGERVALQTPTSVEGLRIADVDGDGLEDLLVLEGRRLRIHAGRKGALPDASPSFTGTLADGVSFVDVAPREAGAGPALLVYGTAGLQRMPVLGAAGGTTAVPGAQPLAWSDSSRAAFAELVVGGGLLLPQADGVAFRPASGGPPVVAKMQRVHAIKAPGPFLEDTTEVRIALPSVLVGRDGVAHGRASDAAALWSIDGSRLVATSAAGPVHWDLSFLAGAEPGKDVEQTLADLDDDGVPELIHRIYTNRDSRYGFFRTRLHPKTSAPGAPGPSHKPAVSDLYLSGYQLPMDLLDLDGDGLKDLVVTAIEVNAANTMRALSTGVVTAETRAFLNRSGSAPDRRFFRDQADALVKSDILVKVRFTYAGTIDVKRSFTILLDGDFDGDGRKDLAIRTGPDEMTLRSGTAEGVWEATGRPLAIPPMGDAVDVDGYAADLDGDGKDEIVLLYRGPPGGRDRLWVLRTA